MRRATHHRPSSRLYLTRRHKCAIYGTIGVLWISGAAWLVAHYFLRQRGPFGDAPNPAEHWLMMAHGAGAFASLWLGGWLWRGHVTPWRRNGTHRRSGTTLLWIGAVLIASGWLLYYASGESLRAGVSLLHWSVGLALAAAMLAHALRSARYRG